MTPFIFNAGTYAVNRDWVAKETRAIKRRHEEGYGVKHGQWKRAYEAAMFRAEMETDIQQRLYKKQQADQAWAIRVGAEHIEKLIDRCDPYTGVSERWRLKSLAQFLEANGHA